MSKAVVIPECGRDISVMKEELSLSPTKKNDGAIGLLSRFLRLESLGKKINTLENQTSMESLKTYYGVYIPCEIKKGPDEEALHVYENKMEALELVRKYKLARFKAFKNRQDAISFALRGAEPVDTTDGNDNSLIAEKPYPFKAPSPQDMVALRKSIEAGLLSKVSDRIWDNPRFLVSSGNTPAIMQEGARYNALHVAAKAMNAELCNLILTTVGNPAFVQKLYGADSDLQSCEEFAGILVDRYLNTPDKAMLETPLHFATKLGAEEVVDILTTFPQCNKTAVNKFGQQPKDIICTRALNATGDCAKRIANMLQEKFYVPVIHTEDETAAPTIGKPFTPASPPEINSDPLSPRCEIRAYAGPMEAQAADTFRRRWKTPPRSTTPARAAFRLRDLSKGLEAVGRNLAEQMKVGWKEYWPFLDTFTDLRTPEGLTLLENYLKAKYETACSFIYSESCAQSQHSPEDFSLSRITLNISQPSQNDDIISPMSELCVALKSCKISSERPAHWMKTDPIRQRMVRQPSFKAMNGDATPTLNHTVSQLLCIERTCQVFAKRIVDALNFSLTAEPDVAGEALKSEAKHLQNTILTYKDDERFQKIDFALTHSRLAQLVVAKLKQQIIDLDEINNLIELLMKLRCPSDDMFSSDDERSPRRLSTRMQSTKVIEEHVRCLASFISDDLTESVVAKGPAISESECTEIWEKASRCRCEWKIETYERNSKKNASFRKNRSILSTSPRGDSFVRRLTFDHDIGDGKLQHPEVVSPISVNSPAGDSGTLFTVDMRKCQVVQAEISDDESIVSCNSESESEFLTASEQSDSEPEDPMQQASDTVLAEPFIYGDEPSKMDRLVFDALFGSEICRETFPNVYRWRHYVGLYQPEERLKWASAPAQCVESPPRGPVGAAGGEGAVLTPRARCSTPNRHTLFDDRSVSLQVSNWLRVTGPNSPRASQASKSVNHNVSLGY